MIDEHVVVLITGISASGKSTVAERLAARFVRGVHVRGDAFRRMVVAGRAEMAPEPSPDALAQLHLRYRLGAATADRPGENGFTYGVLYQREQDIAAASRDAAAAWQSPLG